MRKGRQLIDMSHVTNLSAAELAVSSMLCYCYCYCYLLNYATSLPTFGSGWTVRLEGGVDTLKFLPHLRGNQGTSMTLSLFRSGASIHHVVYVDCPKLLNLQRIFLTTPTHYFAITVISNLVLVQTKGPIMGYTVTPGLANCGKRGSWI